jgi:Tat protein secretion system quality control protein TatD with DNase activity
VIAETIASLKELEFEEVAATTTKNAIELFGLNLDQ